MIPMVSYAQNYEDVVLRRGFDKDTGFYVDIGAAYPSQDSVTKYFYDRGWSGINIEPQADIFELLKEYRPKDTNICCAVSSNPGQATLTTVNGSWGIATLKPEELDTNVKAKGTAEHQVEVRTLNSILEETHPAAIDFIKIDVEGSEAEVLASIDLVKWHPRALVIESTAPLTTTETNNRWEHILDKAGYHCTLFDGLNRFYVHKDEQELAKKLSVPANPFDRYLHHRLWSLIDPAKRRELIKQQEAKGEDVHNFLKFEKEFSDYLKEGAHIKSKQQ